MVALFLNKACEGEDDIIEPDNSQQMDHIRSGLHVDYPVVALCYLMKLDGLVRG